MHIHILGICGTFMGGIALLARELGLEVSGCDENVYPPMSTQLSEAGIGLTEGFDPAQLFPSNKPAPDLVVIGNALSRGNPVVEAVLNSGLPYTSGPAFLADHLLQGRWVLAVAGTHGKTTSASMLAWILEDAGLAPGFLIGGVPRNFGVSARAGQEPFFVVEADEYDTAFFDKRSKFVHYRPRTLALNNLEYDHADIFPNVEAIETQFHHLVRTVPGNGLIVLPAEDAHLQSVMAKGCWSERETITANGPQGWWARLQEADGSHFEVFFDGQSQGTVRWPLMGQHNVQNALAAMACARHAGVPTHCAVEALAKFQPPKRRMEIIGEPKGITVYDDFAHHPTAIETTLRGLRARVGDARIIAVLEPRSNTMRLGVHQNTLGPALAGADEVVIYQGEDIQWDLGPVLAAVAHAKVFQSIADIVNHVTQLARPGDHILIMSNGGFGGLHQKLLQSLGPVNPNITIQPQDTPVHGVKPHHPGH
jgi:UDP-N-acetylmuramate: L-alanyl-gamma-D-glutamyl-meso-diaminopimelate ligase